MRKLTIARRVEDGNGGDVAMDCEGVAHGHMDACGQPLAKREGKECSAEALGQLYFRRWAVELFFHDIKTTLGLDVLRCQTPALVRKEIVMHALAYKLIRALMQDIAHSYQVPVQRLSFKGTVDALRQWREVFENTRGQPRLAGKLRRLFYQSIANDLLLERPARFGPRAVKRRPKNFLLLTKPRHEMIVERNRKRGTKPSNHALN